MAIVLTCPTCGNGSSVADALAGRTVQCPHCAQHMVVPTAEPTYTCAVCRQGFGAESVFDQQGTIICRACFEASPRRPQVEEVADLATAASSARTSRPAQR